MPGLDVRDEAGVTVFADVFSHDETRKQIDAYRTRRSR